MSTETNCLKMQQRQPSLSLKNRMTALCWNFTPLYKQGSGGDVSGDKPGFFDFVGAAKYEAWEKLRGTGEEDAQSRYIELIRKLGGEFLVRPEGIPGDPTQHEGIDPQHQPGLVQ